MNDRNKHDLSISMLRANIVAVIIGVPVAIFQLVSFGILHGAKKMQVTWNILLFLALVVAGIVIHELIHGLTWKVFTKKSFSSIKFGFQWKTLTPYAHLIEPVKVNAYRIGGFMPGLILGIIPYTLSLVLGDGNLLWFGVVHTIAAGGDWLLLWLLRKEKGGTLVEDHPSRAGCYIIED